MKLPSHIARTNKVYENQHNRPKVNKNITTIYGTSDRHSKGYVYIKLILLETRCRPHLPVFVLKLLKNMCTYIKLILLEIRCRPRLPVPAFMVLKKMLVYIISAICRLKSRLNRYSLCGDYPEHTDNHINNRLCFF